MSFLQDQQRSVGDYLGTQRVVAWNRTNAALVKGEVVMADLTAVGGVTGETAVGNTFGDTSVFGNVVPVVQTKAELGWPCYVCLDDNVADNAQGSFAVCGIVEVSSLDDDVATTDLTNGGKIAILVSEADSSGVGALTVGGAAVEGWVSTNSQRRVYGIFLEVGAADSTNVDRKIDTAAHRRKCYWSGGIPLMGVPITT